MICNEDDAKAWLWEQLGDDRESFDQLEQIVARLFEENQRQNLVSQASIAQVWRRHICDSAQLLNHVPRGTSRWLDLGTGAGFPGLVVAVINPGIQVMMVESRAKRVQWLNSMIDELGLRKATVIGDRLERVEAMTVDVISARAFAPLVSLVNLASRFSTSSTRWLLPKGRSASQEVAELKGWRHTFHVEQSLTDPDAGIVVGTLLAPERPHP